ncbi:hypothetical protein SAMN05216188_11872 [Lentzea xinjiangensis]|uniref:Uncharacterized protein n=1 Tax=Lentzea xinjiangensis TaxID=402600 RepID=A0A1H9TE17_9PSEU|nr:hypothetical protein [Lentzea xinjiangensis]SER95570.1 hypothetical protein SAMN05216188_11872 [Lentzea xinjiangensis]
MNRPLNARGWALVLAAVILLDDVTELLDEVSGWRIGVLVADLVLIAWMLLAFYGKRPAAEPGR